MRPLLRLFGIFGIFAENKNHSLYGLHLPRPYPVAIAWMGGAGWRATTGSVNAAAFHARACAWQLCPVRLALAVHLGAYLRHWAGSLGLASLFAPPPLHASRLLQSLVRPRSQLHVQP
jgi:hypothetical protein